MSPSEHVSQIPREELAYQLFRETNDAVVIVDPDTLQVLEVNPAVQRMTGFREDSLLGQDIRSLLTSSTGEIFDSLLSTLNETGIYHSREGFQLKCRNDVRKAVNISANRVHTQSRQLGMVVMRDISARKRAEEKLRQTQELLTEAQRLVGLGSWSYEIPSRRFQYSDTVTEIFGLSQFVPATPESLTAQIVPEQRPHAEAGWHRLMTVGEPVEATYEIRRQDGSTRHISTRARAIESDASGHPVRVIGVTQDITERVLAIQLEEEHQKSLVKLEQVFQEIDGFAWEYDLTTELFTYVSDRAEKMLGYPQSDWLTRTGFFESVIHEDDCDAALSYCRQQTAEGRDHSMDYRMIDHAGQERWIRDIVHLRRDADGEVTHLYGLMLDITERLRLDEELQRSAERYQKLFQRLFDESPDAIFVESLDGVVLNANAAACELHQMSRQKLIGSDVMDLVPEADRQAASLRFNEMAAGTVNEFDSSRRRRDGTIVPVALRVSAIDYAEEPALLIHVRDITDRRRQEEIRREQERHLGHVSRLTMMGQLVAGIAHEIRQPLWSISTFADVCQEALARPDVTDNLDKVRDLTSKLVNESRRVNSITTRMFSFARKGHPERSKSNLYELIAEAVALTRSRAKDNRIDLFCELPEEPLEIVCDRVLVEQTIVNILNNAYTAFRKHESDKREVRVSAGLDDKHAWVEVTDTGPGLPDGIQPEQLFEGFFTTTHTGMGIGLALSRSFVEDHGGSIHASVNGSGGMTFRFTLRLDGGAEDE